MKNERNQAIYEAYVRGDKVVDIAQEFGVDVTRVSKVAQKMGAAPRRAYKPREKHGNKTCPKCHRKIEVKDAKFCYFCGADIRSARDILVERIKNATQLISFLPDNARDEMRAVLCDAIAELQK